MRCTLYDTDGTPYLTKKPDAVLDYKVDLAPLTNGRADAVSDWLAAGETIATATVTSDTGITIDSSSITDSSTTVTIWLSGGTIYENYDVQAEITTSSTPARTTIQIFRVKVRDFSGCAALYSFTDLKKILDLENTSLSDYPALEVLADGVEARIEEYLGSLIILADRTETYRVKRQTKLIPLNAVPIDSVSSVLLDGVVVSSDDYYIDTYGIQLEYSVSSGLFSVTYIGGYRAAPEWLRRALNMQIVYEYQNKDHIGADYVTTDGGSVGRPALNLLTDVKQTLDPHRHAFNRLW